MNEKLEEEFKTELAGLRLEFRSPNHLRVKENVEKISKLEKRNQTPRVIAEIISLKRLVIYLIKMDF